MLPRPLKAFRRVGTQLTPVGAPERISPAGAGLFCRGFHEEDSNPQDLIGTEDDRVGCACIGEPGPGPLPDQAWRSDSVTRKVGRKIVPCGADQPEGWTPYAT